MQLNPKYIMREVAGETLLISLLDISAPKKILCLNELGKAIYTLLTEGKNEDEIIAALLCEYDVDEDTLRADASEFLSTLFDHGVLVK